MLLLNHLHGVFKIFSSFDDSDSKEYQKNICGIERRRPAANGNAEFYSGNDSMARKEFSKLKEHIYRGALCPFFTTSPSNTRWPGLEHDGALSSALGLRRNTKTRHLLCISRNYNRPEGNNCLLIHSFCGTETAVGEKKGNSSSL